MDKLKLIKTIVAVLTFLLVFGTLTALGSIYKKVSAPAPQPSDLALHQPEGSSIEKFTVKDGKLYLLVKYGGQPDRIIVINQTEPQSKPATITLQ